MEMETRRQQLEKGDNVASEEITTVDWRGRPSNPSKHGGMGAAAFVLGLFHAALPLISSICCVCVFPGSS